MIAFILAVCLWAAAALPSMWLRDDPTPAQRAGEIASPVVERFVDSLTRFDFFSCLEAAKYCMVEVPTRVVLEQPWSTAASLAVAIFAWALLGGAIVRTAATEFAVRHRLSMRESVWFSLSKIAHTCFSLAAPLMLVALLAIALRVLGALAASSPTAAGIVGVLFGVLLLLALVGVVAGLAFLLGAPLLLASVVCEGTDTIDALQRTFAYVLGRPVRLVAYSIVFYVQLGALSLACWFLMSSSALFAVRWVFAPDTSDRLSRVTPFARDAHSAWMLIFAALASAVVLSFFHSGSAVLYLLLRQANDGQDPADLWQPGHAEAARAALARTEQEPGREGAEEEDDA